LLERLKILLGLTQVLFGALAFAGSHRRGVLLAIAYLFLEIAGTAAQLTFQRFPLFLQLGLQILEELVFGKQGIRVDVDDGFRSRSRRPVGWIGACIG